MSCLDADGDGIVTKDEFEQYTRQLLQKQLKRPSLTEKPSRVSRGTWLLVFASILLSTAAMGGFIMYERHHVEEEVKLTDRRLIRRLRVHGKRTPEGDPTHDPLLEAFNQHIDKDQSALKKRLSQAQAAWEEAAERLKDCQTFYTPGYSIYCTL